MKEEEVEEEGGSDLDTAANKKKVAMAAFELHYARIVSSFPLFSTRFNF